MSDISWSLGGYLDVDATGDILMSSGSQLTTERVLRRLLTNPGSYIWHLDYGAGVARFIGQPTKPNQLNGLALAQMVLEPTVLQNPPPATSVVQGAPGSGTSTLTVTYGDALTGLTQTISQQVF